MSVADGHARERALAPDASILLQAPAGSGKTEVLTQRFLSLLALVDEPEEVLALTFTRKAAAEMRERILKVLQGDIDPRRPTAAVLTRLREAVLARAALRDWDAVELRSRLRIQTIDSLNHEIARSLPLFGGGPPSLDVTDDASALHLAAARQTLRDAESDPRFEAAVDLVLRRLDNNWARAEELIAGMLARRGQWLRTVLAHDASVLPDVVQAGIASLVQEAVEAVHARLPAALRQRFSVLLRDIARWHAEAARERAGDEPWQRWLEADAELGREASRLTEWCALAALVLTQEGGWRKRLTVNEGLPAKQKTAKDEAFALIGACCDIGGLRERLASLQRLPPVVLGGEERAALSALAELLRFAAANLRFVFQREGRVDHTEVAAIARSALVELGSPTELAMRRAAALKHLLVDEFQDTSSEQSQLLETLLVGWAPEDGRSLFVVGDPMQSIYQFRSAEVALFLRAREQGIGDVPLEYLRLTRNFRSLHPLIEWCNSAFVDIFPPDDDVRESAVSFLPAHPGAQRAATSPGEVRVHVLAAPDAIAEGVRIAEEIAAARERRPGCSIAVLVQASSHAPPIIDALRARGIVARGVELEPLARQPAVRDVVELGCALLHPADRVAWLAVLRSPMCGLALADLLALTEGADAEVPVPMLLAEAARVAGLSADARLRLERCAPVLLQSLAERGRLDFVVQLKRCWESLGGPAALADETEWHHVLAYLTALRKRAADAALVDGTLLRSLAETLRLGGEGTTGAVEVLTIHKAKGLEWDVVFLPGLHRKLRGDDRPLLSWIELPRPDRDADLLMAALSVGRGRSDDRLGAYIAQLRAQRQRHERARLAYVAATRAREELHVFGFARANSKGELRPGPNSMLHTFWPALARIFAEQRQPEPEVVVTPPQEPVLTVRRLPAGWRSPSPPPAPVAQSLRVGALVDQVLTPEYEWASIRRRAVGTVVHGELEAMGTAHGASAEGRESGWRTRFTELGVTGDELDLAVEEAWTLLRGAAEDAQLQWILSDAHEEPASEFRLSGFVGGQLRDVIIDRTFIDGGTRWVIDYKTGTHEGADLEAFLASELERYRPQLELYRTLARGLGPQPVRAALYFPAMRRLVEL